MDGEAKDLIINIDVTAENYSDAWKIIENFYDNKRRLTNHYVNSFLSIRPMKAESFTELRRLKKGTLDTLNALSKLGRSIEETGEDLVVNITVNKFDPDTRREWEKKLGSSSTPPTFKDLKDFLENQEYTQESIEKGNKTFISSSQKSAVKVHSSSDNDQPKSKTCPLCSE